jgi:hypothetical protein
VGGPQLNPEESVRRTEAEIRRAKAETLGRVGERLDAALAELAERDRRLDGLLAALGPGQRPDPRLAQEIDARNRLRSEAMGLVQQLVIQREALGLVRHATVHERYPVPPRRPALSSGMAGS